MSFQRRKCLLPDDDITKISPKIRLDTFQNYSRISCTLECTARYECTSRIIEQLIQNNSNRVSSALNDVTRESWSSSEDEGLHYSNCQTNLSIVLNELSIVHFNFIKTSAHHSGSWEHTSASTKELHGLT